MTPAEFKTKWAKVSAKESAAYQSHFDDLCRLLMVPTPLEADPTGEFFCFQKRVVKDVELFVLDDAGEETEPSERGFADVWKKGCFAWEYKGKKKNLDEAYRQLLRYRESLLNPPLLVVCDFDRYIVRTNFNGAVQETHEFTNAQIDRPENLRLLRALFENPDFLKPQRTTAQVTEALAETIAEVAKSLQKREAEELADAKTRAEMNFAQRKNLRIARFLNRIVFCFFAEDTGLLPKNLFSEVLKTGLDDPRHLAETLENLFAVMAKGGTFGKDRIRHFNGHLFEESTVFELTEDELRKLADAGEADWQFIQPSIMGTLFERALEPEQRSQLGAHYTSEADIKTLVEPVLMAPLRREWAALKGELAAALGRDALPRVRRRGSDALPDARDKLAAFQKKLAALSVLDPACGSGNFLYVSLQLLLGLEKEAITYATQLGFKLAPQVSVQQLRAIEINPYAFELAQVSVQIGFLQWRRDNGFDNDRSPVLQNLDGFQNEDALLVPHFHSKPKTLKEAQAGEHAGDDALKFYTEREWPKCDVIVSNPPFLGTKKLRSELGDDYVEELFRIYANRIPNFSDLCCYWFEKARQLIERGKCKRAGLLATQGIRGGRNREVLKSIQASGGIFFAESDRPWVLDGANVHVSMVGFDDGSEKSVTLDGKAVAKIHPNLTAASDTTTSLQLAVNTNTAFIGDVKGGSFEVTDETARNWLVAPNPNGKPNSDVLLPWINSLDILRRPRNLWIVDFGCQSALPHAAGYELPFAHIQKHVFPHRQQVSNPRERVQWWIHSRPCGSMRDAIAPFERYIVTNTLSKHRVFAWQSAPILPDHQLAAFGKADGFFFGLLQSHFHSTWALRQGTRLETRPRYTPTTCFETFPFPFADDLQPLPAPIEPPAMSKKQPEPDRTYAENLAAHNYFMGEPRPYESDGRSRREEAHSEVRSESDEGRSNLRLVTSTPTKHRPAIAAAAKELNDLRERWLNPPEWTETRTLEFPGTVGGPWDRYMVRQDSQDLQDSRTATANDPVHLVNPVKNQIGTVRYPRLEPRDADCAAKLKKRTLTNLYNERPAWLDLAHQKLDAAVAAAYGWPADLTDEQILEKLLALNLERAAEEEEKAAKAKKPKASREKTDEEML
jgi:type II restriction/modification system DNA methylase subunit YeeA